MKNCARCGDSFKIDPDRAAQKYCGQECFARSRRESKRLASRARDVKQRKARLSSVCECSHCGTSYLRKDGFPKYCSTRCRKASSSASGNARRRAQIGTARSAFSFLDIYNRDDGCCSLCDKPTPLSLRGTTDDLAPELDHIIPLSRGGHHTYYNVQIACRDCNNKKGNRIYSRDRKKAAMLWPEKPAIYSPASRPTSRNKSGERGVFYDQAKDRWIARFEKDGKRKSRTFKTHEEAIEARRAMVKEHASKEKPKLTEGDITRRASR